MNLYMTLSELTKLGEINDEVALRAADKLDDMEKSKLTKGQIGRYAALGAVAVPTASVVGNVIARGLPAAFEGTGVKGKLRHVAGNAVKGAIGTSLVPVARDKIERHTNEKTLKKYLQQEKKEKTAMNVEMMKAFSDEFRKIAADKQAGMVSNLAGASGGVSRGLTGGITGGAPAGAASAGFKNFQAGGAAPALNVRQTPMPSKPMPPRGALNPGGGML